MRVLILIILAVSLSSCIGENKNQVLASCFLQYDPTHRIGTMMSEETGRLISLCMASHGFEVDAAAAKSCADFALVPECYKPATLENKIRAYIVASFMTDEKVTQEQRKKVVQEQKESVMQEQEKAAFETERKKKEQEKATFEIERKTFCESEPKRWTAVPPSQIEVRDVSVVPSTAYIATGNYTITASIKNKSKPYLTALKLNVTALDCPTQDARIGDCDVIGHDEKIFRANIPGGEVRQINEPINFDDVPKIRGVFSPRVTVKGVRAAIDQHENSDWPGNEDYFQLQWIYQCK